MPNSEPGEELPPFSNIDRIIHEPARMMIMANLFVVDRADFLFLETQTGLSPGNLSSHLSKLESAGYVEITKWFMGKKPSTMIRLTKAGRKAFKKYTSSMKAILDKLPKEERNGEHQSNR
jgi:DNA-binding MarR family transcriptional regulator